MSEGRKVANLALAGNFVTSNFTLSSDGSGGAIAVDRGRRLD